MDGASVAPGRAPHGLGELVQPHGLEQEAGSAGADRVPDETVLLERRQHQHQHWEPLPADTSRRVASMPSSRRIRTSMSTTSGRSGRALTTECHDAASVSRNKTRPGRHTPAAGSGFGALGDGTA